MAGSATDPKPYQLIPPPIHLTAWSEPLQRVVPGWKVTARWSRTGAIMNVFVPDDADLASTADALIRFQGQQLDALAAL